MRFNSDVPASIALSAVMVLAACSREITGPIPVVLTAQNSVVGAPLAWSAFLGQPASFTVGVQSADAHSGGHAAFLTNAGSVSGSTFATIDQFVLADAYIGHRVMLSGWVRPTAVELPIAAAAAAGDPQPVSGLWLRIDGVDSKLAFDNMQYRPVVGTSDWHMVSIVLDVPSNAIGIAFGALFSGSGQLLVDDLRLDTVSVSVPTTNMLNAPVADSLNLRIYQGAPAAPANLDFDEALPRSGSLRRTWQTPSVWSNIQPK